MAALAFVISTPPFAHALATHLLKRVNDSSNTLNLPLSRPGLTLAVPYSPFGMSSLDTSRRPTFWSMFNRAPDEIIENGLYLGGLGAALDAELMNSLGITHILSICPECSWDIPTRRAIHLNDDPDENILIRLPEACQFIEGALKDGGKIYVHCIMGISRSVTVVCAYLMKSQGMSAEKALSYVKSKRPVARPNFGFLEQLDVWKACSYSPSVLNPVYNAWKHQKEENGLLLTSSSEPMYLGDRLYMTEDLPQGVQPLTSFMRRSSTTHLLTITPYQPITVNECCPLMDRCHLSLEDGLSDEIVLKLPEAVEFIDQGLKESQEAVILIHSFDLTRICIVACAYWMTVRGLDSAAAFRLLRFGLPLYNPTTDFTDVISLFEACGCAPTPAHPEILAVRERRKEEQANRRVQSLQKNVNTLRTTWQMSSHKNMEQEGMDPT